MKKGFTMIELIFVIVILGILASVAIPRLAATRTDAEISAAVANIRTLISDAAAYYAVKGEFDSTVKWRDITNVPLYKDWTGVPIDSSDQAVKAVYLGVADDKECILLGLVDRSGNTPAHIKFWPKSGVLGDVCKQVRNSDAIKAYIESKIDANTNGIAIGSSTTIY
ncbi:MAG: type II secretion system GspH family protein [Campylobacter sp.]|uniref:type II secretion system protein n=1 Tax=Campylobacter sp. TaxID=205 RepID=UPI002AA766AE|nr:type II secretion system protein [Campylobacter sp.]MCI7246525.1 type II secretion system GspH family protein [Campylobacter sp.]